MTPPPTSHSKSIALNATYLGLSRAITSLSRIIYAVFLARMLGAELYGLYNYGLSWYLILLPISILGLDWVLYKEIPFNRQRTQFITRNSLFLRILVSTILTAGSILTAYILEPTPEIRILLIIFSFALLCRNIVLLHYSVFTSLERSYLVLKSELIFRSLEVTLGITALLLGYGIHEVALIHTTSWSVQLIYVHWILRRTIGHITGPISLHYNLSITKKGIPFLVASLSAVWITQGSIFMSRFFGGITDDLGYIALSIQALVIITTITSEIGNAALPTICRSMTEGQDKSLAYINETLRIGSFMGPTLFILSFFLIDPLLKLLVGAEYLPSAKTIPLILLLVTPLFWNTSLMGLVGSNGKYVSLITANLAGSLSFTISYIYLSPLLHDTGIILSIGAGSITTFLFYYRIIGKDYSIDTKKHLLLPLISGTSGVMTAIFFYNINDSLLLMALSFLFMLITAILTGAIKKSDVRKFASAFNGSVPRN